MMISESAVSEFTRDDYRHMSRALKLARNGINTCHPNPRVGCVIVKNGDVLAQGWHETAGQPHAEVMALQKAGDKAAGAAVYVTLEPCSHQGRTPPCANALIDAGVAEVVIAMQDPNPLVAGQGIEKLQQAGIRVKSGLLKNQATELNRGFIRRMTHGKPWVTVKLGASLDGRTAMNNGESKWITGPEARSDVQRLRAQSSAILTGSGTVLADDPSLNVRQEDVKRQPLRVVMDSNLSIPDTAKMLNDGLPLLVATTCDDEDDRFSMLVQRGVDLITLRNRGNRIDANALMERLAGDYSCNEVLVEAGPTLCGDLMANQLVDEVIIYLAPVLLGTDSRGMFTVPGLESIAEKIHLTITDVAAVGHDWRITAHPEYHSTLE
jgi:diaminohydroxyphosphoribosylaminopyrimidine deaminase/5-amino-6-(5-phosphoribosylamino)uracil reductase